MSGTTLPADTLMTAVRIFAVSLNQTPLSWDDNYENIRCALEAARAEGAELICLPELCVSGYGCEDAFLWPQTAELCLAMVERIAPLTQKLVVTLGLPLWVEGRLYNASLLVCDGKLLGAACKRHLAREGIHYEPRWFNAWPEGCLKQVQLLGQSVPVGDLIFDIAGLRVAFEICEDAWVEARPAKELASQAVDVILNPSASHFAFDKHLVRRQLVVDGARSTRLAYVYCNLLGNEAGRAIYDGDCLLARAGAEPAIIAESRRFSFNSFQMAGASFPLHARWDVLPESLSPEQRSTGLSSSEQSGSEERGAGPRRVCVFADFHFATQCGPIFSSKTPGEFVSGELPREQAFARAVALGLFDYLCGEFDGAPDGAFVLGGTRGGAHAESVLVCRAIARHN
jgi:NAD+ synthase (glutamine-hydrolysing)